jgi:hypothetical protein
VEQIPSCEVDITVLKQKVHKLVLKSLPWIMWINSTSISVRSDNDLCLGLTGWNFVCIYSLLCLLIFPPNLSNQYYSTFQTFFSLTTITIHNMYTYHSQYKTCTCTNVTIQNIYTHHSQIQNMCTYHCHNTKHVHVPLSQYKTHTPSSVIIKKTCTRITVTIQNVYTYNCHITKHVHVPLLKYKTCTRATVTIQNMYT